jgi:hypothetical protein
LIRQSDSANTPTSDGEQDCKDKERDCKDRERDCKDRERDCKDKLVQVNISSSSLRNITRDGVSRATKVITDVTMMWKVNDVKRRSKVTAATLL